ncbi:MAG: peptide-methionine (S)-S-oxide reductase MsrA [Gammaproteobacteria bacterium]|nr:peptide-methionine (S)-S-oxide reductase MsrA [Gammaproteobacteria bacterium]
MVSQADALPGRLESLNIDSTHAIFANDFTAEVASDQREVLLGLGCFWGAERVFWQVPGVVTTAVGYAAGYTKNPTYEEVCTSNTGHSEVVRVVYNPSEVTLEALLKTFFEKHDPTQFMRQGNDIGTQYRSGIYVSSDADFDVANKVLATYNEQLVAAGMAKATTEILKDVDFYYAETYHQQYLHKNPQGYCGIGGTGVSCPI